MFPARSIVSRSAPTFSKTVRATRLPRTPQQIRFQSSTTSSAGGSSHLVAGVAGGVAATSVLYAAYLFTPSGKTSRAFNKYANEANAKFKEAARKLEQKTPDAEQTASYIRDLCYSYVSWVPGGRQYVDAAFKDYDKVRRNHREEVDEIVSDAYKRLRDVSKSGLSVETATKAADVLADLSKKIGSLAGDALGDIMDNHPQLKEKFGDNIEQLKEMGEAYGPEAKKQVDNAWNQVRDVMAGGLSSANLEKARSIIEEQVGQLQKLGDEAWKKGIEQAKPYLEKNSKVKELIEKNEDALKHGNTKEVFGQVKKAAESGNTSSLEEYIKSIADKAKSKSSMLGLDQYFDMIPQGSEILPKLKQLKEVAEKHSEEGQRLLEETMKEVKRVLENKSQKAQEIMDRAKKDVQ